MLREQRLQTGHVINSNNVPISAEALGTPRRQDSQGIQSEKPAKISFFSFMSSKYVQRVKINTCLPPT
jgi:hypothetical protein